MAGIGEMRLCPQVAGPTSSPQLGRREHKVTGLPCLSSCCIQNGPGVGAVELAAAPQKRSVSTSQGPWPYVLG